MGEVLFPLRDLVFLGDGGLDKGPLNGAAPHTSICSVALQAVTRGTMPDKGTTAGCMTHPGREEEEGITFGEPPLGEGGKHM